LQHSISLTCNFLGLRVDSFELGHFEEWRTFFGVDFIGNEFIFQLLKTIDVRVTSVQAAHQLRFRWNSSLLHLLILQTRSGGLLVTQQEMRQMRKKIIVQGYSRKQRSPPKRLPAGPTTSSENVVPLFEFQLHFYCRDLFGLFRVNTTGRKGLAAFHPAGFSYHGASFKRIQNYDNLNKLTTAPDLSK
jgi:hypothetical protein